MPYFFVMVYLLLGSNLGNSLLLIAKARQHISSKIGHITAQSPVYKTAPWGNMYQPMFYNQVIAIDTVLEPIELLDATQAIEADMGRVRLQHWGARVIDIDILGYNDLIVATQRLSIPHILLPKRRFALLPLSNIAHDWVHPILQLTVKEMLQYCTDDLFCEQVDEKENV